MSELKLVCQNHILAREPSPLEYRIKTSWYPEEDGEITERIRVKIAKQLRKIEGRRIKNGLGSLHFQTYGTGETKAF